MMSDRLVATIISIGIGTIGFIITFFTTMKKNRQELMLFERNLSGKFGEKLYEIRLKHYGRAFEITDRLGKTDGLKEEEILPYFQQKIKELREWKMGEVNLVISDKSIEKFYDLLNATRLDETQTTSYSVEQKALIWDTRNNFRKSLREDLGLLRKIDEA